MKIGQPIFQILYTFIFILPPAYAAFFTLAVSIFSIEVGSEAQQK